MNIDFILEREKSVIDEICLQYNYDQNIRHLLYVIIPAFMLKYGINREKVILQTLREVRISTTTNESKRIRAYYMSTPRRENNKIITIKRIVIANYKSSDYVDFIDDFVHEFNHAINSCINEIKITKTQLLLRTGLSYRIFRKEDLWFIKKHSSYILEEIINTRQTEDIINIMKEMTTSNEEVKNSILAITRESPNRYQSHSYYLQSEICREILNNKTFISTLENLRIQGEVFEIKKWFDNITGEKDSYLKLVTSLEKIHDLEVKYSTQKIFKGVTIRKIKEEKIVVDRIIEKYNKNVVYK